MEKNGLKNPGRVLEIGAGVAFPFASRSFKPALEPLPEVLNLYHTGKGIYLSKSV